MTGPASEPGPDAISAARASLLRSTLFYGAVLAGAVVVVWWVATNAASGAAFVTLALAAGFALLLAYFLAQHVRDLRAAPVERSGLITRKWSRADFIIVMQSYYITVDRTVFRIQPEDYVLLDEGMRVRVTHFPHTLHVVSVRQEGGGG